MKFNHQRIYRRAYDRKFCVDRVMHWSDLGLVTIDDVLDSVNLNLPHLNPLKWVTIKVFDTAAELDYFLKNKEAPKKV